MQHAPADAHARSRLAFTRSCSYRSFQSYARQRLDPLPIQGRGVLSSLQASLQLSVGVQHHVHDHVSRSVLLALALALAREKWAA
eukprot:747607-Hanusia_phi.AAC.6